ncbi:nucleobase-ascorbate transporter 4-like [Pistacia vera]|uniref:nucleobase-ascorbate transporter 4-like n=1 Tax=Pistacia vera TaxID=55513 RepID=UPI001263402D|nr:nucleobase-ascorbate transporter 4-like [Pistacia vera]
MASLFHMIIGFFGFWRIFGSSSGNSYWTWVYALGFPQLAKCIEMDSSITDIGSILVLPLKIGGIIDDLQSCSPSLLVGYAEDKGSISFQWGGPSFNAGDFCNDGFFLVAYYESTGTFIAASDMGAPLLCHLRTSRGIGWQGIGILLEVFLAQEVAPLLQCLLGLTRNGSRRVVQISALFMISLCLGVASFQHIFQVIFSSPATVAIMVAYFWTALTVLGTAQPGETGQALVGKVPVFRTGYKE